MRKIEGYDLVTEAGEFKKLPAGIYKLQIKEVVDDPEREYLEIHFDIIDGEFKNYFAATQEGYGKTYRSYKLNALPFFKAFITAVEKTNSGFVWSWDEKALANKFVVGVFREEEFIKDNEIKIGTKLCDFRSAQALKEGTIKIPEIKRLTEAEKASIIPAETYKEDPVLTIPDSDLPF